MTLCLRNIRNGGRAPLSLEIELGPLGGRVIDVLELRKAVCGSLQETSSPRVCLGDIELYRCYDCAASTGVLLVDGATVCVPTSPTQGYVAFYEREPMKDWAVPPLSSLFRPGDFVWMRTAGGVVWVARIRDPATVALTFYRRKVGGNRRRRLYQAYPSSSAGIELEMLNLIDESQVRCTSGCAAACGFHAHVIEVTAEFD